MDRLNLTEEDIKELQKIGATDEQIGMLVNEGFSNEQFEALGSEMKSRLNEIVGRNAERTAAGEKVDNFKGNVSNSLQLANTINSIRNASKQKREGRDLYNEGKNFTPTVDFQRSPMQDQLGSEAMNNRNQGLTEQQKNNYNAEAQLAQENYENAARLMSNNSGRGQNALQMAMINRLRANKGMVDQDTIARGNNQQLARMAANEDQKFLDMQNRFNMDVGMNKLGMANWQQRQGKSMQDNANTDMSNQLASGVYKGTNIAGDIYQGIQNRRVDNALAPTTPVNKTFIEKEVDEDIEGYGIPMYNMGVNPYETYS